jgi:hypothetical protein
MITLKYRKKTGKKQEKRKKSGEKQGRPKAAPDFQTDTGF